MLRNTKKMVLGAVAVAVGLFHASGAQAADAIYDASGDWTWSTTDNYATGCDPDDDTTGNALVDQSGNNFTVQIQGETSDVGSIDGADYVYTASYPEDGGVTSESTSFTLTSAETAVGTSTWVWSNGGGSCSGGKNVTATKVDDVPSLGLIGLAALSGLLSVAAHRKLSD